MIARSTLFTIRGGDTVQIAETAKQLRLSGVEADIKLTHEMIEYNRYDLLHFFNVIRPADILYHVRKSGKPYVISPIMVDYSEYDRYNRRGLTGWFFRMQSADGVEYCKTLARWILGKDRLMTKSYLWNGHKQSVKQVLKNAALILPNSVSEYNRITVKYGGSYLCKVIPNGIDEQLFNNNEFTERDCRMVLCIARVEGIKNQYNLIKALNNTRYQLYLIGDAAPNQRSYYEACVGIAGSNIHFIDHLPQSELIEYYKRAGVHILPSWFETTGLSSLEAAAMGCCIVITDKGDTREYFEDLVFYCDPAFPETILSAVDKAAATVANPKLKKRVAEKYTWSKAAEATLEAYHQITGRV